MLLLALLLVLAVAPRELVLTVVLVLALLLVLAVAPRKPVLAVVPLSLHHRRAALGRSQLASTMLALVQLPT